MTSTRSTMPHFRYIVGLIVACLIIAAGAIFCTSTRQKFVKNLRDAVRAEQAAGSLPPELQDVDPDTLTPEGWNLETSAVDVYRIWIADILSQYWFVLVPLVLSICLGIAFLVGHIRS